MLLLSKGSGFLQHLLEVKFFVPKDLHEASHELSASISVSAFSFHPSASRTNMISSTEGFAAPENDGAPNLTTTATIKEALVVDGSRRTSILPRSASMGNIGSLRSAAGSRASDLPRPSHSAVQSLAIEDPFLSPEKPLQTCSATSITPPQQDRVQVIQAVKTPEQDLSPRQDRLGQEVTPANAQGVHTPAACVFMAK